MLPNPEELLEILYQQMEGAIPWHAKLIGIHSGGVWLAERLSQRLSNHPEVGTLDISFYRDDYDQRGLAAKVQATHIPFQVENSHLILVDDVLYTGRSVRAALNELFDYGRPASVSLAVLIDRGGRELPIEAQFVGCRLAVPLAQKLFLQKTVNNSLTLSLTD